MCVYSEIYMLCVRNCSVTVQSGHHTAFVAYNLLNEKNDIYSGVMSRVDLKEYRHCGTKRL